MLATGSPGASADRQQATQSTDTASDTWGVEDGRPKEPTFEKVLPKKMARQMKKEKMKAAKEAATELTIRQQKSKQKESTWIEGGQDEAGSMTSSTSTMSHKGSTLSSESSHDRGHRPEPEVIPSQPAARARTLRQMMMSNPDTLEVDEESRVEMENKQISYNAPSGEIKFNGEFATDLPLVSSKSFDDFGITFGADCSLSPGSQTAGDQGTIPANIVSPVNSPSNGFDGDGATLEFVYDPSLELSFHQSTQNITHNPTDFPPISQQSYEDGTNSYSAQSYADKTKAEDFCSIWDIEESRAAEAGAAKSKRNKSRPRRRVRKSEGSTVEISPVSKGLGSWADLLKKSSTPENLTSSRESSPTKAATISGVLSPTSDPGSSPEKRKSKKRGVKTKSRRGTTLSLGEFLKPEALEHCDQLPEPDSEFWQSVDIEAEMMKGLEFPPIGYDQLADLELEHNLECEECSSDLITIDKHCTASPNDIDMVSAAGDECKQQQYQQEIGETADNKATSPLMDDNTGYRSEQTTPTVPLPNGNPSPIHTNRPSSPSPHSRGFVPMYFPGMYSLPPFIDLQTKAMIEAKRVLTDGAMAINCPPDRFDRNLAKPLMVQWVQSIIAILRNERALDKSAHKYLALLESYQLNLSQVDWNMLALPVQGNISMDLDLVLLSQIIFLTSHFANMSPPASVQVPTTVQSPVSNPSSCTFTPLVASPCEMSAVPPHTPPAIMKGAIDVHSLEEEASNITFIHPSNLVPAPVSTNTCTDEGVVYGATNNKADDFIKSQDCGLQTMDQQYEPVSKPFVQKSSSAVMPTVPPTSINVSSLEELVHAAAKPNDHDLSQGDTDPKVPSAPLSGLTSPTHLPKLESAEKTQNLKEDPTTSAYEREDSEASHLPRLSQTPVLNFIDLECFENQPPANEKEEEEQAEANEDTTLDFPSLNEMPLSFLDFESLSQCKVQAERVATEETSGMGSLEERLGIQHEDLPSISSSDKSQEDCKVISNTSLGIGAVEEEDKLTVDEVNERDGEVGEKSELEPDVLRGDTPVNDIENDEQTLAIATDNHNFDNSHSCHEDEPLVETETDKQTTPTKTSQLVDLSALPSQIEGSPEFLNMSHDQDERYDHVDPDYIPGTIIKKKWLKRKGFFARTAALEKYMEAERERVRQDGGCEVYGYNRPPDTGHVGSLASGDSTTPNSSQVEAGSEDQDQDSKCHYWLPSDIVAITGSSSDPINGLPEAGADVKKPTPTLPVADPQAKGKTVSVLDEESGSREPDQTFSTENAKCKKKTGMESNVIFPYSITDQQRSNPKPYHFPMPQWSRWRALLDELKATGATKKIGRISFPRGEHVHKLTVGIG